MNLADIQGGFQAMLAASAPAAGVPDGPGRAVYRNNYRAQLVSCLEESFPLLRTFIGDEAFLHAAAAHIGRQPPHAWTIDAYADGFCATLQALFPDNPDLHELAWIEHALGQAFIAPDASPVGADALAAVDWDQARLLLTPTLQLHGALDTATLPRTAQGSGRYVIAPYEWRLIPDAGHFLHQEAPDFVTGEILRWLKTA